MFNADMLHSMLTVSTCRSKSMLFSLDGHVAKVPLSHRKSSWARSDDVSICHFLAAFSARRFDPAIRDLVCFLIRWPQRAPRVAGFRLTSWALTRCVGRWSDAARSVLNTPTTKIVAVDPYTHKALTNCAIFELCQFHEHLSLRNTNHSQMHMMVSGSPGHDNK